MFLHQKVKLNKNLWAAPGGVAILPNAGAHSEIRLHNQNSNAIQFPIHPGAVGSIFEISEKEFVIRLTQNENLSGLVSLQQINFTVKKSAFGFFFSQVI